MTHHLPNVPRLLVPTVDREALSVSGISSVVVSVSVGWWVIQAGGTRLLCSSATPSAIITGSVTSLRLPPAKGPACPISVGQLRARLRCSCVCVRACMCVCVQACMCACMYVCARTCVCENTTSRCICCIQAPGRCRAHLQRDTGPARCWAGGSGALCASGTWTLSSVAGPGKARGCLRGPGVGRWEGWRLLPPAALSPWPRPRLGPAPVAVTEAPGVQPHGHSPWPCHAVSSPSLGRGSFWHSSIELKINNRNTRRSVGMGKSTHL